MAEPNAGGRLAAQDLACIRGERPVFSGVNFALEPGGALLLHGPNGSGKSSLLRILAGFLPPAGGALTWDGADVAETLDDYRGRIHFVGHLDAVKPTLTVAENLAFWAALRGHHAPAPGALARFDLEPLADLPGRFLSAGQKRRLALTRLVASPAALWLLDEPSVTLDAESTGKLEAAIARHRAEGGMVVVATHTAVGLEAAERLDMAAHAVPIDVLTGPSATDGDGSEIDEPEYDAW